MYYTYSSLANFKFTSTPSLTSTFWFQIFTRVVAVVAVVAVLASILLLNTKHRSCEL